jgi:hypothetical protein
MRGGAAPEDGEARKLEVIRGLVQLALEEVAVTRFLEMYLAKAT